MKKSLYIDKPFQNCFGGDKNRSRFLWRVLAAHYDAEIGLLEESADDAARVGEVPPKLWFSEPKGFRNPLLPDCVFRYDSKSREAFEAIQSDTPYDFLFFRFLSTALLSRQLSDTNRPPIIVDADLVASRLSWQSWNNKRTIRNRYFFLEALKLMAFERDMYQRPFLYLLTNTDELQWARDQYKKIGVPEDRFALVANPMPDVAPEVVAEAQKADSNYILFHGALGSSVNWDAYQFMLREIYPLIAAELEKRDLWIHVVGKGMFPEHEQIKEEMGATRVKLVGQVDDIGEAIANSLLCLIPLRLGSGTKTRVLEAAAYGKCVVTTPLGLEGLEFGPEELEIGTTGKELGDILISLLGDGDRIKELAHNLNTKSLSLYSEAIVGQQLVEAIDEHCS